MTGRGWAAALGVPVALAAVLGMSLAHDGERHTEPAGSGMTPAAATPSHIGLRGERLADGAVFLPKPAQFSLGVRTQLGAPDSHAASAVLNGQVIPDPNHSAIVASAEAGILEAPPGGFPVLGREVRKGEVVAYLRPLISGAEQTRRRTALAKLTKQDIALNTLDRTMVQAQIRYQSAMASTNSVIQALETEASALHARQRALAASLDRRLPLTAPVSGTISLANARIGALVQPGQTVFEILDPLHLRVRVPAYDPAVGGDIAGAHAVSERGADVQLDFIGQGSQMQNQSVPLDFAVVAADGPLRVGQPLAVHLTAQRQQAGIVLPSASLIRAADGTDVVWVQTRAERFVARRVAATPLGRDRILVTDGAKAGERIVTANAWLLSQIH
jgi:RND family efflux transporter MFP subunit